MRARPAQPSRRRLHGAAARADRYDLYQRAVQAPEADVDFFTTLFSDVRGRIPMSLREDFAGTAYLSALWVRSRPGRRAVAVDSDREPLDWGRRHHLADGAPARHVRVVEADVRHVLDDPVDIVCAPNFSICCLHERRELVTYVEAARSSLVDDGLFIVELYGGTEAVVASTERRELDGFDYTWEQESFNPIDHRATCHIHFEFDDGSRLDRAFSYDFRLWSIPEIRDALVEAGFAAIEIHWEAVDDEGEGTGDYRRTEEEENQEGWLAYVVGLR